MGCFASRAGAAGATGAPSCEEPPPTRRAEGPAADDDAARAHAAEPAAGEEPSDGQGAAGEGASRAAADRAAAVEQILAACRVGRALEAQRLLDALREDALVGEAEAARIRGVAHSLVEVIASMNAVLETVTFGEAPGTSTDSGASPWNSRSVQSGDVYFKYGKSTGEAEVVGFLTVEIDAVEMWALLREFDLAHSWVPRMTEGYALHSFAPYRDVYIVDYSSPQRGLISPMVAIHDRAYFDALDDLGCLAVLVDGPGAADTAWQGLRLPAARPGVRRVHQRLINRVQPVARGRCVFSMHIHLSTGIYFLPDWLVGMVATSMVNQLVGKLQTAKARWVSGGWKDRMESGPRAEYYASLQQRVEALLAKSADIKTSGDPLARTA